MRALGVTNAQLETALAQFGTNAGGGFTDQNAREYLIRNIGRTMSLDDLRNLVVATVNDAPVYLRQVAEVSFAPKVKRGDAGYMAKPAVIVSVEKQPDIDTVRLTRIHRDRPEGAQPDPARRDQADQVLFRQADFIETSIRNVERVLVEAVLVVAVVLFAFLLNVRTTAISLLAIPVSVLTTAVVFHLFGLSINTMTLGGLAIAIGELVDDAVVDVENIYRRSARTGGQATRKACSRWWWRPPTRCAPASSTRRSSSSWCSCRSSRCRALRAGSSPRWGRPTSSRSWRAYSPPSP